MVETKDCPKCKNNLPLDAFYKKKNGFYTSWCSKCTIDNQLNKRKAYKEQGLCRCCGNKRLKGSTVCFYHFVYLLSNKYQANAEKLIDKLKEQNFKCFYTNTLLLPSVNASLDHIVPRSKGGTDEIDNLVWVDISVNNMKGNADLETFLLNYSTQLNEMKILASLEPIEIQQTRLNYVLGTN